MDALLACWEVRAGRTEDALGHLCSAAVSRRIGMIAAKDPDLAVLRDEPAFAEIVG